MHVGKNAFSVLESRVARKRGIWGRPLMGCYIIVLLSFDTFCVTSSCKASPLACATLNKVPKQQKVDQP